MECLNCREEIIYETHNDLCSECHNHLKKFIKKLEQQTIKKVLDMIISKQEALTPLVTKHEWATDRRAELMNLKIEIKEDFNVPDE